MLSRRHLLKIVAAVQCLPLMPSATRASSKIASSTKATFAKAGGKSKISFGPVAPFDFDILKKLAADIAAKPYVPPPTPDPSIVKTMDYDTALSIKPDPDYFLYSHGDGPYPVMFLTIGGLFPKSVRLFSLEGETAREVLFRSDYFKSPPGGPLSRLPTTPAPFAGFEIKQAADKVDLRDHEGWSRFIGASYFRAVGEANQFGLSARGLAQNTGIANPEEFPDFTHFWIEESTSDGGPVHVYAILDGPSLAGAYRFIMHRDRAVTMDITCDLHLRKPIERLGIAPLTSMFWYSETVKGAGTDLAAGNPRFRRARDVERQGEHLWRPLIDPETLAISAFQDENPRGFGLMQRDKNYDHYLDAVYYEKRPCGWVEPVGDWGKGAVQLVEIPTDNEIYDNVIAFWVPAEPNHAGQVLTYRYKLLWRDTDPFPGDLALCVATRLGAGAVQGAPRSKILRKFMIEFKGANLKAVEENQAIEPVITVSRGTISSVLSEQSPDGDDAMWRTQFDLDPQGKDVVEMRCFLRYKGKPLTETWTYRYLPFESPVR